MTVYVPTFKERKPKWMSDELWVDAFFWTVMLEWEIRRSVRDLVEETDRQYQ